MKPLPWSATALAEFKNCPRQFHAKRVTKELPWEDSAAQRWGNYCHEAFEKHMRDGVPLPPDLTMHQPFMERMKSWPGETYVELKIALNHKLEPCDFWAKDVWFRSKVDYMNVEKGCIRIVDYKTGRVKIEWDQHELYFLWATYMWPSLVTGDLHFYFTQDPKAAGTRRVVNAAARDAIWAKFLPDLHQYSQAFVTDTWQPRPSGLCAGWCGKTDCGYWSPRRK